MYQTHPAAGYRLYKPAVCSTQERLLFPGSENKTLYVLLYFHNFRRGNDRTCNRCDGSRHRTDDRDEASPYPPRKTHCQPPPSPTYNKSFIGQTSSFSVPHFSMTHLLSKQFSRFSHSFRNRNSKRTSGFALLAADTFRGGIAKQHIM